MIFGDFLKAVAQMIDPRFRRVLFLGIGLTLGLLFCVYAAVLAPVSAFTPDTITLPILGEVHWVSNLISGASVLLMLVLSIFLMVPVASAFTSMFLEDVAQAVEDRHYPHLPAAPRIPFAQGLRDTLNFLGLVIIANLLALILYILFAPFALFIFWGLNGFLLGREYFQLVAMRRVGWQAAKALGQKHWFNIWVAGALMTMPLSIPLVNLLIPILGAATFTHLYHRLEG